MAEQPTADELYGRHHRDIYRYLARMTGSPDAADDLSGEVFLRVVRGLQNGGPIGHERGWVFSIAHHVVSDVHRQRQRAVPVAAPSAGEAEPHSRLPLNEPRQEGTQALAVALGQSLQSLPEADRNVFLLKEVAGLSYQEIAQASGYTVESVRSRLHRARTTLRDLLSIRF